MSLLREPRRGEAITADWARELVRAVRSLRILGGPGLKVSTTPNGTTVSVADDAGTPQGHFGDADEAEERDSWAVEDGEPGVIRISVPSGDSVEMTVDSRGNIVKWGIGRDGEDPKTDTPPECGNPLNYAGGTGETDSPLDAPAVSGGGGRPTRDSVPGEETDHPLDHEGDGGYTPECEE